MATNTKWLLTRTMSLGFCRDTFKAGSVIVELEDSLLVNGKEYKDNRDMDILKRQMLRCPDDAWIIPYTEEDERALLNTGKADVVVKKRPPTDHSMPVISSDEDLIEEIDVSNTQISVINERKREEQKKLAKSGKFEVIPDHEDIEDRISRIAKKSDAAALAERVALKSGGIQKMNVVRDDTLGAQYNSSKNPSLNAGTVIPAKHYEPAKEAPRDNLEKPSPDEDGARFLGIEKMFKKIIGEYIVEFAPVLEFAKKIPELVQKIEYAIEIVKKFESLADKFKMLEPYAEKLSKFEEIAGKLSKLEDISGKVESLLEMFRSSEAGEGISETIVLPDSTSTDSDDVIVTEVESPNENEVTEDGVNSAEVHTEIVVEDNVKPKKRTRTAKAKAKAKK